MAYALGGLGLLLMLAGFFAFSAGAGETFSLSLFCAGPILFIVSLIVANRNRPGRKA